MALGWGKPSPLAGQNRVNLNPSRIVITLYKDVTPNGNPIRDETLNQPKLIVVGGTPEIKVDVNGHILGSLPPAGPESQQSPSDGNEAGEEEGA